MADKLVRTGKNFEQLAREEGREGGRKEGRKEGREEACESIIASLMQQLQITHERALELSGLSKPNPSVQRQQMPGRMNLG